MQPLILGVLAFAVGSALVWHQSRTARRIAGCVLAVGGVAYALWNHPAHARLARERNDVRGLCSATSHVVEEWGTPVSERYDYKFSRDLLDEVAFQSAQATVLQHVLAPIVRRCVAEWTGDCQGWLDALAIPEDDSNPFVVPPGRARTSAALQEALRTHRCPKYTPMSSTEHGS